MTVISVISSAFQPTMRQASRKIVWRSSARHSPGIQRYFILVQNSAKVRPNARSVPISVFSTAYRSGCRRSLTTSGGPRFPPVAEAASVSFPGRDLRVSRVGFGSPWIGAASDRGLDLSRCEIFLVLSLICSISSSQACCCCCVSLFWIQERN